MARPMSEAAVANIVKAVREAGRPVTASDLVGKPYTHRTRISSLLNEAERRGLVRRSCAQRADGRGDLLAWEVCDG